MKRRRLVLMPIVIGLLLVIATGIQTAKADVNYDLNNDGTVDIKDIAYVATAFGSSPGGSRWNPVCDLDGNGVVGIRDLGLVAIHFGE